MIVSDLPTPALLVDRARLLANLDAAQARADAQGVALRPHAKTHRSPDLARLQRARGAKGLTVSTVGEAERFAEAGFDDLVLAREVSTENALTRLADLAETGVRLAFCVDTIRGANLADAVFAARHLTADVFVEVDTGHGRCGVVWDDRDAPALVGHVVNRAALRLRGLLTHAGHSYSGPHEGESAAAALDRVMAEERDRLLHFAARLVAAGYLDPATAELSVGSTPTFSRFVNAERDGLRITEVRPGNYVFHDAQQVGLGAATLAQCALTVESAVISRRRDHDGTDRVYADAGKKALSMDTGYGVPGYGTILYSPRTMVPNPHAALVALSEEHAWIRVPGGAITEVGDRVRILPNHACLAVALQSRLYVVDGEEVVEEWEVLKG